MQFVNRSNVISFALLSFVLSGCSTREDAPAEVIMNKDINPFHKVSSGETLESIAQKYGLSKNELIRMNRLKAPFKVYKGQKLLVGTQSKGKTIKQKNTLTDTSSGVTIKGVTSVADTGDVEVKSLDNEQTDTLAADSASASNTLGSTPLESSSAAEKQAPIETETPSQDTTSAATTPQKMEAPASTGSLQWPARGPLLSSFGKNSGAGGQKNDGINIAAPAGSPVVAADNGVVAYVGNQVRGFGNVVLIKHANGKITIYGHLQEATVKANQRIQAGQQIGKVGVTGGKDKPQVYFGLRHGKKSLNPMDFLK